MTLTSNSSCLLVRRAGRTRVFPLTGDSIQFGYAPSQPGGLILHDSLLEDVHGEISIEPGRSRPDGTIHYRLRALGPGVKIDDAELPSLSAVKVQLRIGHEIKVGSHYTLIVAEHYGEAPDGERPKRAASELLSSDYKSQPLPTELESYFSASQLLLPFLPEIYSSHGGVLTNEEAFLSRFLALFESVLLPLKWGVDEFSVYLHPQSAAPEMLPWLADWYGIPFDQNLLSEQQQRDILTNLPELIQKKGSRAGLKQLLALYTPHKQEPIIQDGDKKDGDDGIQMYFFTVEFASFPEPEGQFRILIQDLIAWYKPAHTYFQLK